MEHSVKTIVFAVIVMAAHFSFKVHTCKAQYPSEVASCVLFK